MRTEVITVSTKGQVVLPAPMRKELNIKALVLGLRDRQHDGGHVRQGLHAVG